MSYNRSSGKRSNEDDDDNEGSRRSRCRSDANDDDFTTPAVRSSRVLRNAFKCCPDISGLDSAHHCDGCQRFGNSTRKINKPRAEITTKTPQCLEIWKLYPSEIPPNKLHHYERVMEAIQKFERMEPTALIENLGNATVNNNNNDNAIPTPSPPPPPPPPPQPQPQSLPFRRNVLLLEE